MLESSGAYASCPEKILKMWCSLVYILIRLCLEKIPKNGHIQCVYISNDYIKHFI